VQEEVRDVIAGGIGPPQAPLEPERGVGDRPVVDGVGGEPKAEDACRVSDERAVRDQNVVVEKEVAVQARGVGKALLVLCPRNILS